MDYRGRSSRRACSTLLQTFSFSQHAKQSISHPSNVASCWFSVMCKPLKQRGMNHAHCILSAPHPKELQKTKSWRKSWTAEWKILLFMFNHVISWSQTYLFIYSTRTIQININTDVGQNAGHRAKPNLQTLCLFILLQILQIKALYILLVTLPAL